ncbi:conserved hypothetical protein [Prochlorococcus marinus str. MIT 9515]|uniref:Uncharacterized protein n=1 Tax=Prochlorococcus marinus (strain MIT 9515) TaxID=167542 RepID=A2BU13_PROM5|nr:hypothetical protein [Prochlorococcus marinus]ABM71274.1 conserved hypothetical protein [Prochlorococcus marinus str. MIT 9515]
MNRWVLLEHKILGSKLIDVHYDFLVEDQLDCLTWKFHEIPLLNKGFIKIGKQPNHRLIWLSRVEYQLSNNRGLVKRIDHGTFSSVLNQQNSQELKYLLNGTLLKGLLIIDGNFCQLINNN